MAYGSVALAAIGLGAPIAAASAILFGFAELELASRTPAPSPSTWVYVPFAVIPIVCGTAAFFLASAVRTRTRLRRRLVTVAQRLGMLDAAVGLFAGVFLVLFQG